jgi:hypothetical protein
MAKAARYLYSCATCGGPVKKPALVAKRHVENEKSEGKKPIQRGLHGWQCVGECGKKGVKVRRVLAPKEKDQ